MSVIYGDCHYAECLLCLMSLCCVSFILNVIMLSVFYAAFHYAECILCWMSLYWVSFMLNVIMLNDFYAECHYAECLLCWMSLCWVSFMLNVIILSVVSPKEIVTFLATFCLTIFCNFNKNRKLDITLYCIYFITNSCKLRP